jgi:hypothetical protein
MKQPIQRLAAVACALTLAACGSAFLQPEGSAVPGFYQPGGAWDEPQAPAADAQGAGTAKPTGAGLAPQELPKPEPDTWLADATPVAGPAPRNAISGGVLDVGIVPAAPEGTAEVAQQRHGIEPTESGRLYILELYQEVLEQRDALMIELNGMTGELERAQGELASLHAAASADQASVGKLQQELALLRAENQDLAARLTTAQIRRLEAEKLLLEAKIAAQRARIDAGPPILSGASGAAGAAGIAKTENP